MSIVPEQLLKEKEKEYGDAVKNMTRYADVVRWYIYYKFGTKIDFKGSDMANIEVLHKMSREVGKHKEDNYVDVIGYATIALDCKKSEVTE